MRKIEKTDSEIVISVNNQNKVLEMYISMKFDADCNATTLTISCYRFHEHCEMVTAKT